MNVGRYYSVVMPIAGLLYVVALIISQSGTVAAVGALVLGIVAIAGRLFAGR